MKTTDFDLPAEWKWLFSDEGQTILNETQTRGMTDELKCLTFLREKKHLSPEQAGLIVQQIQLRKRAVEKFPETASKMLFTPVGLEQSTDAWIAAYKASRFPKGIPIADICCGIGGDLSALALEHPVLGIDANPVTAAIAKWNSEIILDFFENNLKINQINNEPFFGTSVYNKNGLSVSTERLSSRNRVVKCSRAETFLEETQPNDFPSIHIDPDRRSEGVRTSQLVWFSPGLDVLEKLLEGRQTAAIKLAPGTRIPEVWLERASELEWISRNRECRELVVWFRKDERGSEGPVRRATQLEAHSSVVRSTLAGAADLPIPVAAKAGKFIFDVDPAFLASGLEGELARKYHLSRFGAGTAYLTGDTEIISDSALTAFEILRILPLDKKGIIKEVRERNWSKPEIKKRGNVPEPEIVRKWLPVRPKGESGTIILVQTLGKCLAIFSRRLD